MDLSSSIQPRVDQIPDYLLLRVHRDGAPGREIRKVDPMPAATEAQLDSVMHQPLFLQPLTHAGFNQKVGCSLLQDTRAYAFLQILARVFLENDGFNAIPVQQMRKHQPGGSCADYPDLGPHAFSISSFAI
jgi:hypothetical protein